MQKSLSYDDVVRLEDLFDKFAEHKHACLSDAERNESLLDFQTTFRDTDDFETLEQFEDAVFNGGAWDFKCDTTAPEDPQPKADEEDRQRLKNGQEPCGNGYMMKTTFWQDFTIADRFGKDGVQDTFNRAFAEWRSNCIFLTELVLVLNWKIWQQHNLAQNKAAAANKLLEEAQNARRAAQMTLSGRLEDEAKKAKADAALAEDLAKLYDRLWREADEFACDNLKGAEHTYFYNVTD